MNQETSSTAIHTMGPKRNWLRLARFGRSEFVMCDLSIATFNSTGAAEPVSYLITQRLRQLFALTRIRAELDA